MSNLHQQGEPFSLFFLFPDIRTYLYPIYTMVYLSYVDPSFPKIKSNRAKIVLIHNLNNFSSHISLKISLKKLTRHQRHILFFKSTLILKISQIILQLLLYNIGKDLLELLDQDPQDKVSFQDKSATLKSTNTDYNTPPESPVMPHPLFKTIGESMDKPPVPPPR